MLGLINPNVMQLVFWLVVYLPTPLKNMVYNCLHWLMVVNGWLMDCYYNIIYLVGGWYANPSEKSWSESQLG